MQEYELRIYNDNRTLALQTSASYFGDFAATRAAQNMCRPGQVAEVWRGDCCVFTTRPSATRDNLNSAPNRPAA